MAPAMPGWVTRVREAPPPSGIFLMDWLAASFQYRCEESTAKLVCKPSWTSGVGIPPESGTLINVLVLEDGSSPIQYSRFASIAISDTNPGKDARTTAGPPATGI